MPKNLLKTKNKDSVNKKLISLLILVYFIILIWIIVFKCNNIASLHIEKNRAMSISERITNKAIPFKHTFEAIFYHNSTLEILALIFNIICFIPLGSLFRYFKSSYQTLFICGVFSLAVEIFQLFSGWGGPDIIDIVLNILGAWLGVLIFRYILSRLSVKTLNTIAFCLICVSVPFAVFVIIRSIIYFPG